MKAISKIDSEVGDKPLGTVPGQYGDAAAGPEALVLQTGGDAARMVVDLGPAKAVPYAVHGLVEPIRVGSLRHMGGELLQRERVVHRYFTGLHRPHQLSS